MASMANHDNTNQAEAYNQTLGDNLQHAAGTVVVDGNSEEYLPQPDTISPADPALTAYERRAIDLNDHSPGAASSLESQAFTASPHSNCFPTASNSHSTSDTISSCGMVDRENVVRDIFQPSLQPFNTLGYLQPWASATYSQSYDYANNTQSMALAHNIPPYIAPSDAESFNNTRPGLEPFFDMGNVPFAQNTGNLDSNYIGEQGAFPTNFQPHFDIMSANNVFQHPHSTDDGAFSILPRPYAESASAQMVDPFDQHQAPQPMQGYAPDGNPQLLHDPSSILHPGFAESIEMPAAISQSVYPNDSWRTGIATNDQLGNLGNLPQIQPPESFGYTNSFMTPGFSNVPPNGRDALYGPSGDILFNVQQPTEYSRQGGITSLDSHSYYANTVENSTIPNQSISSYPIGDPFPSEAAGAPSTEMVLRPLEPITHPLAPSLPVGTETSVNPPREARSVIYGPKRPPQKSSRQLSKRSHHRIQKPASETKFLATQKKHEERAKLELSRLEHRFSIPESSMGFLGTCVPSDAKKRGKGTQKAARERGTCIRCHIRRLKCDSGEGECCNNCQEYWAKQAAGSTLWRWTRNNWKSLAKAYGEWLQFISPPDHHSLLWRLPIDTDINSILSKDTWSMFVGVVDSLSGPDYTARRVLSTISSNVLHVWSYAGQIFRYHKGLEFLNPEREKDLLKALVVFMSHSWKVLLFMEDLEKQADPRYISFLALILIEWEFTFMDFDDKFGKWSLEAITTRLKIALSRLHENQKHDLEPYRHVHCMLNESVAGRLLLPEQYHGLVWEHRRERTAHCLPYFTCVDPLHHGKGCWCGLIFQSVPLGLLWFYGVLDAAEDNPSQWRDFVGNHCSWTRKLGKMEIHGWHTNGNYKRRMRWAFQNHLRLVLDAFFFFAKDWQTDTILSFTVQDLLVDWKTWRRRMFVAVLYVTAEQFLITVSKHTLHETPHADTLRDRVWQSASNLFQVLFLARKTWVLRAQSPGYPQLDALEHMHELSLRFVKRHWGIDL